MTRACVCGGGLQITLTLLIIPSFIRMLYVMTMHPVLGKLVQSIFLMVVDMLTFLCVYCVNWGCFTVVFHLLFFDDPNSNQYYITYTSSALTLFAASLAQFDVTGNEYSFDPTLDPSVNDFLAVKNVVGNILIVAYVMFSNVLLLNILIAMMAHSFDVINDDGKNRYKFGRSKYAGATCEVAMHELIDGLSVPAWAVALWTPRCSV